MSRQGPLGAAHSQSDRYRRRLLAAAGLSEGGTRRNVAVRVPPADNVNDLEHSRSLIGPKLGTPDHLAQIGL